MIAIDLYGYIGDMISLRKDAKGGVRRWSLNFTWRRHLDGLLDLTAIIAINWMNCWKLCLRRFDYYHRASLR
jgi:hypothetical protein